MNDNGERWADFCQENGLVIGRTLYPHEECHKRTWVSPDGGRESQIDHNYGIKQEMDGFTAGC